MFSSNLCSFLMSIGIMLNRDTLTAAFLLITIVGVSNMLVKIIIKSTQNTQVTQENDNEEAKEPAVIQMEEIPQDYNDSVQTQDNHDQENENNHDIQNDILDDNNRQNEDNHDIKNNNCTQVYDQEINNTLLRLETYKKELEEIHLRLREISNQLGSD